MPRLFLSALALLALTGCDGNDPQPVIGDLTVTLNPPFVEGNQLLIQTEETFSEMCALGIAADVEDASAEIEITGNHPAVVCLTALGPWSASARLPDADLDGYRIELVKDGARDEFVIRSNGEGLPLSLQAVRTSFSRVVPPVYPED